MNVNVIYNESFMGTREVSRLQSTQIFIGRRFDNGTSMPE